MRHVSFLPSTILNTWLTGKFTSMRTKLTVIQSQDIGRRNIPVLSKLS